MANFDTPNVNNYLLLIYLAGIILGLLGSVWIPTRIVANPVAWIVGGFLIFWGVVLAGAAIVRFRGRRHDNSTRPCRQ